MGEHIYFYSPASGRLSVIGEGDLWIMVKKQTDSVQSIFVCLKRTCIFIFK